MYVFHVCWTAYWCVTGPVVRFDVFISPGQHSWLIIWDKESINNKKDMFTTHTHLRKQRQTHKHTPTPNTHHIGFDVMVTPGMTEHVIINTHTHTHTHTYGAPSVTDLSLWTVCILCDDGHSFIIKPCYSIMPFVQEKHKHFSVASSKYGRQLILSWTENKTDDTYMLLLFILWEKGTEFTHFMNLNSCYVLLTVLI